MLFTEQRFFQGVKFFTQLAKWRSVKSASAMTVVESLGVVVCMHGEQSECDLKPHFA